MGFGDSWETRAVRRRGALRRIDAEGARLGSASAALLIALILPALAAWCLHAPPTARAQDAQTPQPTPTQTPTPAPTPTPAATQTPTPTPTLTPTPPPATYADEEVERVETDLTNVLLTAVDKNRRFVTALTREDVRVLEDGVPQQILSFERETDAPLSLALLVDASASQERVMKDEQAAARDFVASVLRPAQDTAAVLSFTGILRLEQPLTSDTNQLNAAIDRLRVEYVFNSPECEDDQTPAEIRIRCLTAVWDSVGLTVEKVLARTPERTRRAVILLSDGDDTASRLRLYQAVEQAVRGNTVVYSVGIRDRDFPVGEMRRDYLRRVAEETGGRAFFPRTRADLAAAFAQIEQELRSQYLISYTPTNRARDASFRKIEVEITNPALRKQKLRLLYRQGYYARAASPPAEGANDE